MSNELQAMSLIEDIKECHAQAREKLNEGFAYAIRCGELLSEAKALLKAEKSTTFGVWVEQFFDFSPRSARRYMKLHKDLGKLSERTRLAVLKSADSVSAIQTLLPSPKKPPKPEPKTESSQEEPETFPEDPEIVPDPFEEPETVETVTTPASGNGTPPKQYDRSAWYKQYYQSIGTPVRLVDKIAGSVGEKQCKHHKAVQRHLNNATEAMAEWMGVQE